MNFNDIVTNAVSNITGIQTDVTTVVVSVIAIFVVLLGLDIILSTILGGAGSSEKRDNITFESCHASLRRVRKQERFMNVKYGRGHSRVWDSADDVYIEKKNRRKD